MGELVEQARLSQTRFSNHRNNLALSATCSLQGCPKLVDFFIAPDKARETPPPFAGIHTTSDLNRHPPCPPHSVSIALHRLLHSERCIARTNRMIFVSQWSAKQRHDAVAH